MNILDLSSFTAERYFIVGAIEGNYTALINLLYEQFFTYHDILVLTGNFIHEESQQLVDLLAFLRNNENCFSVLGKKEADLLEKYESHEEIPDKLSVLLEDDIDSYLATLPSIIKLPNYYYVVNAGLEPYKPLDEQIDSVFYSIKEYDPESRFYQFFNPENKSWYEFKFEDMKVCFTNSNLSEVTVDAGYNLGSVSGGNLYSLILTKDSEILVSL